MSDTTARESVTDLSRRLLEQAYPEKNSSWIDEQVKLAVQRVNQAGPQPAKTGAEATQLSIHSASHFITRGRQALRVHARILTIAVALIVIVVVAAVTVEPGRLASSVAEKSGIYNLLIAAISTFAVAVAIQVRARREKILSCRVRVNSRLDSDVGGTVKLQRPDATAVEDPGMMVARIKNLGSTPIEPGDYIAPLTLSFPGREVVTVDVTESVPQDLQDIIPRDPGFRMERDRVVLPKVPLQPGNSFKLVVVLSGTKVGETHGVVTAGRLRKGTITTTEPKMRKTKRVAIAWGGLTVLAAGALAVSLLLNYASPFAKRPEGLACVPGSLTVEGSSAFDIAMTKSAGSYQSFCPGSFIDVKTPGSLDGLKHLRDAPETERQGRLALSDGIAEERIFPGLTPRPVAIVPFTLTANEKSPVDKLSLDQARAIFTGRVSHWNEITGNPRDTAEIYVIGRTSSSGTRRTLEKYVLGAPGTQVASTSDSCRDRRQGDEKALALVCERNSTAELVNEVANVDFAIGYADVPDVKQTTGVKQVQLDGRDATLSNIRAGYPFWTVEYAYSYGALKAGSLPAAFADYLSSPEGSNTISSFQYYACRQDNLNVADLCNSRR